MRRALALLSLLLLLLLATPLVWLGFTEGGLHWAFAQGKDRLPGKLQIDRLEGHLLGPITLNDLHYEQGGMQLVARKVVLEWSPSALLAGTFHLQQLHIHKLQLTLPTTPLTGKGDSVKPLPELFLPWRVALEDGRVQGLSLLHNGQQLELQQIQLAASAYFNQLQIHTLALTAEHYSAKLQGQLQVSQDYRHSFDLSWRYHLPSQGVLQGTGRLQGDLSRLSLQQILSGPLQANIEAQAQELLTKFRWQAKLKGKSDNLALLHRTLPAAQASMRAKAEGDLTQASLSGELDGSSTQTGPLTAAFALQYHGGNSIHIEQFKLHAPLNDTRIVARGDWSPGAKGGSARLALQWTKLRWPLQGPAWFSSALGSGWVEGDLAHYRLGLATQRPWPQAPVSDWYASADGNSEGLNFHSLRIAALGGEVLAQGRLHWLPRFNWQAEVQASSIDPGRFWPEWPGRLRGHLTSQGSYQDKGLVAMTQIKAIEGQLRGNPVMLQGRLDWHDEGMDIEQLRFHSANSEAHLSGRLGHTLQLDWAVHSEDLAQLYPQARGRFQAKGKLSGPRQSPLIQASLKGQGLALAGYGMEALEAELGLDLFTWKHIDMQLAAQGLQLRQYALQSLALRADSQGLEAEAHGKDLSTKLVLRGTATERAWQGQIEKLEITSPRFHQWKLSAPAKLKLSTEAVQTGSICLQSEEARLCTNHKWEDKKLASELRLQRFPLVLFTPWLPADLSLEGVTDAEAALQWQGPEQLSGHAHIVLPAGVVNYPLLEGERERWQYRSGSLDVQLEASGLTATTELTLDNGDGLKGQLALPGLQLLTLDSQHQALAGEVQLQLHDLGAIEALVPEIQDLQGQVAMQVMIAGTLAQPRFSGKAKLNQGALRIPRLGLNIDQLNLEAQSQGLERLDYRLDARSGEGNLSLQGHTLLNQDQGWPTEMTLAGKDFEVSRIPEARVTVSPQLHVQAQHRNIHINGEIHIPYARLQPRDITTAARVSNDVVIVGGAQSEIEKWAVFTRIRLTLGERVSFYGFGFEGRLGGSLLLEDEPGQLTKATGEITVAEGRYRAYGQHLEVEHGRLLYTGGPLSNPGLDLRAVRQVDDVTAGLKVRGSLRQPQVELFSIPAMGQTNALAYLMLGHPIESASGEEGAMLAKAALALGLSGGDQLARTLGERFGLDEMRVESGGHGDQASLVMGRYLSPRLYISYSVGLIEAINTLSVRYQLSRHWQLKGESGEYQGADLLYTIEH